MEVVWDGVRLAATLDADWVTKRNAVADASRAYQWQHLLKALTGSPELVNTTRLDGPSL